MLASSDINNSILNKCVKDGYTFFRKVTRNMKNIFGHTWYEKLHEYASIVEVSRIYTKNSKYCITSTARLTHCDESEGVGFIPRVCDILCGMYFDPNEWKKGTVIHFSNYPKDDAEENHFFNWQIVLNNDDGFYPCCFGDFGIFPVLCLQYSYIKYRIVWMQKETKPLTMKIAGLNLGSPYRSFLAQRHPSPSWSMLMVKDGFLHGDLTEDKKKEDDRLFEWNHLDWAANRIKKALREWVKIRKTRRFFQQSVMPELRALPELGLDYFDCLERWPK